MSRTNIFFIILTLFTLNLHAYTISNDEILTKTYLNFLKETIPEEFIDDFYEYTKDDIDSGVELIAMAQHESQWIHMISNVNNNGSIDLGPLMLNSYNIKNDTFMDQFSPKNVNFSSEYNQYMVVCINFYRSLKSEIESVWLTLQVYNGGRRVLRADHSTKLYKQTANYADIVYKKIKNYRLKWENYKINNLEESRRQIMKEKSLLLYLAQLEELKQKALPNWLIPIIFEQNNKNNELSSCILFEVFLLDIYDRRLLYIFRKTNDIFQTFV